MRRLLSNTDMEEGLAALVALDSRLIPVREIAGDVALRFSPPGFLGLARIITAQMLSVASASAIWRRLETTLGTVSAERLLAAEEETLRLCGLSRGKIRTLKSLAHAERNGLTIEALTDEPEAEVIAALTALPGIGLWTAEIFLLFCARRADIFPAGDLALRLAAAEGLALGTPPSEKEMRAMAQSWAPWRGVAAKLFWAYYKARREGRTTLPV